MDRREERYRVLLAIFSVIFLVYAVSPVRTPYDSRWSIYEAMSFLRGHDGNLAEYQSMLEKQDFYGIEYLNGKPYLYFPMGVSVLATPFVAIASIVDPSFNESLKSRMPAKFEAIISSFYGALAGTIFYALVLYRFGSRPIALGATLIFCFCTAMWSTATRALWQHGPLVLMLLIAMVLLVRARERPALIQYAGLPLSAAFLVRPTAAVPIALISLYILVFYRSWFLRYAMGAVVIAVPWVLHNLETYHTILAPYYQSSRLAGGSNRSEALLGSLISPARGLLVYSPVLVLAFSGFALALRDSSERWLDITLMASAVGIWLVISQFGDWSGGHCYGPRLMTDVLPFLAYFVAFNFRYLRDLRPFRRGASLAGVVLLIVPSLILHAEGALFYAPYRWNVEPTYIEKAHQRLWDWKDPQFLRIVRR